MNTQNSDKVICEVNFTICGVRGFKTVVAGSASAQKRMFSALNDMDRKFRDQHKVLDDVDVDDDSPQRRALKRAIATISTIKNRYVAHQDFTQLVADCMMFPMTTEQFFSGSSALYKENVDNFLAKLDEIDVAIDKHISDLAAANSDKVPLSNFSASIYLCSGAIFGEKQFVIFLTPREICEMGDGNHELAIQAFVARSLNMVKSFRLSDYLRLSGDPQEIVKQDILFIDNQLDLLHEIKIVNLGPVMAPASMSPKIGKSSQEKIKNISVSLVLESEKRLDDYVIAVYSARHPAENK